MKLYVSAKGFITYKRKVLIVRESADYVDGTEAGKWDLPGGRLEEGEPLLEGLVREIEEESGLSITPGSVVHAFDSFPVIRGEQCQIVRVYFECRTETDAVVLSADHDSYEWIDPANYTEYQIMPALLSAFSRYVELKG